MSIIREAQQLSRISLEIKVKSKYQNNKIYIANSVTHKINNLSFFFFFLFEVGRVKTFGLK